MAISLDKANEIRYCIEMHGFDAENVQEWCENNELNESDVDEFFNRCNYYWNRKAYDAA